MTKIKYRASIDGMRAIAVLSVLMFHLDETLLPGGFVGVDIFFFISGYLITSIIYAEIATQTFSFARFYQRRIARIFPVYFAVTAAVLISASFTYAPQDYASAGALAAASALSLANMKLMLQGDYFQMSPDAQPFLHYWSLSVEEQFYVILPLLILIMIRARMKKQLMLSTLAGIAMVSLTACIIWTDTKPTYAFYLLPSRAWELLGGSLLAIYVAGRPQRPPSRLDGAVGQVGLVVAFGSLALITPDSRFPGIVALVPVIATAAVIGRSHHESQRTERMLSLPPLVFIGKLSYSLYLWHWPIYCFTDYRLYLNSETIRIPIKIILTVAFAVLSFYTIERPARAYLSKPRNRRINFAGMALGVLAFSVIGINIRQGNYINSAPSDVAKGGVSFPIQGASQRVVLMGDSNASMYGKVLTEIGVELGAHTNVLSVAAGDPFPPNPLFNDSIDFLASTSPEVTVLVAAWESKISDEPGLLQSALRAVLEHSNHVILVTQPPTLPDSGTRDHIREFGFRPIREEKLVRLRRLAINSLVKSFATERVLVIDIEAAFSLTDGSIRFFGPEGQQLFQDRTHLSGNGADLVKIMLASEIRALLNH